MALERRLAVAAVWRQHFSGLWLNYLGGVFGGMLLMLLAAMHTSNVIILLIPLPVILYMAFRHAVGRSQDQISHLGKVNRVYIAAIEALAQAVDRFGLGRHRPLRIEIGMEGAPGLNPVEKF